MSIILRKDKNVTVSALFGIAAVQVLVGAIYGSLHWLSPTGYYGAMDVLFMISGVAYIILGLAAHRVRLPAAIVASVLFAALLQTRASLHVASVTGNVFTVVVVALLLVAVVAALRRPATS